MSLPPTKLSQPYKAEPPSRNQVLKYMSLWKTFCIQAIRQPCDHCISVQKTWCVWKPLIHKQAETSRHHAPTFRPPGVCIVELEMYFLSAICYLPMAFFPTVLPPPPPFSKVENILSLSFRNGPMNLQKPNSMIGSPKLVSSA